MSLDGPLADIEDAKMNKNPTRAISLPSGKRGTYTNNYSTRTADEHYVKPIKQSPE